MHERFDTADDTLNTILLRLDALLKEPELQAVVERKGSSGHIFLSYTRRNASTALTIRNALEDAGYAVWQDTTAIKGGEDWIHAIEAGIEQSAAIVTVVSHESRESKWVTIEYLHAERRGKHIVPILIDDSEIPTQLLADNVVSGYPALDAGMAGVIAALPPVQIKLTESTVSTPTHVSHIDRRSVELAYLDRVILRFQTLQTIYTPMAGVAQIRVKRAGDDIKMVAMGRPDQQPHPDAVWRCYYDTAEHVLREYAKNGKGIDALAYQMQLTGWPFRDKSGNPCAMESDDIRRIVANWPEYGGYVTERRARERHPHDYDVGHARLDPERAVYPIDLLYSVGRVRNERSIRRPVSDGAKQEDYSYALNGVTYCAHCERLAQEQDNASLRTRLGGKGKGTDGRYRHKHGVSCGCKNRSVKAEIYEADFARLLSLLTIRPAQIDLMIELGIQATRATASVETIDAENEKQQAIAKCRRKMEAARHLYEDGDISREEYVRRKDRNEREMAHSEARTTETERIAVELTLCFEALDRIANGWATSDDGSDRRWYAACSPTSFMISMCSALSISGSGRGQIDG